MEVKVNNFRGTSINLNSVNHYQDFNNNCDNCENISTMYDLDKLNQAAWSPTVELLINISYTKILDIDTINQRFQAEAIIESKWVDPSITAFNPKIDQKSIWTPDLYIENGIKDIKEEVTYQIVPVRAEEVAKYTTKNKNKNEMIFMVSEMRKVIIKKLLNFLFKNL